MTDHFHWNALDQADAYRAAALKLRNAGGSTVRVVARTTTQPNEAAAGSWGRLVAEARFSWRDAKAG